MSDTVVIKNGKKPLSSKPTSNQISYDDIFGNALNLPPDVEAEFKANDLVPHWLNAQTVTNMGGYDAQGWQIYLRKRASDTISGNDLKFGRDPEGVLRRGDLILGYKTREAYLKHKAFIQQKTDNQMQTQKARAQELRDMAKSASLNAKIHEGYDENE